MQGTTNQLLPNDGTCINRRNWIDLKRKVTWRSSVSALLVLATISGIGCGGRSHSVSLSWNPEASRVKGYYVYRGEQTGGPYTKISSLLPGTTYTDTTVAAGQTYYYVVTALGTNSVESGYSNEAAASVP